MEKELLDITKKSSFVFFGKVFSVITTLLLNFIAARFLGASIYGRFQYLFSFYVIIGFIFTFGLSGGVIYYIPKLKAQNKNHKIKNIVSTCLIIVSVTNIFIIILLLINNKFISEKILNNSNLSDLFIISVFYIFLISINRLLSSISRAYENIKYYILANNFIIPITKLSLLLVFLFLGLEELSLILSFSIAFIISIIFLVIKLQKDYKILTKNIFKFDENLKELFIFSLPLLFSGLLWMLMTKTDVLMIGYFLKDADVGVYSVALRIGLLSSFLLIAFNMIFKPIISKLYHKQEIDKLSIFYKLLTKWIVLGNFVFFSIVLIFNSSIMRVFGKEFVAGSLALILVTIGQVVHSAVGLSGSIIIMTGYSHYDFYTNLIAVIVNIILNVSLIPILGIEGAAIASLAGFSIANFLKVLIVYKLHKIHPFSWDLFKLFTPLIISISLVVGLNNILNIKWYMQFSLLTIMFIIIVAILYYFFFLSLEDKMIIEAIKRKFGIDD